MRRPPREVTWRTRLEDWLEAPQPIERLALARIVLPLVLLAFQSSRLIHADHWLSPVGFRVPYLADTTGASRSTSRRCRREWPGRSRS